jgi:hypothetical protein
MARRAVYGASRAVHHAFARGNRTQSVFVCNHGRRLYLHLLGEVVRRSGWRVPAYCLMATTAGTCSRDASGRRRYVDFVELR